MFIDISWLTIVLNIKLVVLSNDVHNFWVLTIQTCSFTYSFDLVNCAFEQECDISKGCTFRLLCRVDGTYCVCSCAIICMYSSLVSLQMLSSSKLLEFEHR